PSGWAEPAPLAAETVALGCGSRVWGIGCADAAGRLWRQRRLGNPAEWKHAEHERLGIVILHGERGFGAVIRRRHWRRRRWSRSHLRDELGAIVAGPT